VINDPFVRRAYRVRSWLLCHVGIHFWARRRNSEVSGAAALFDECRRCGNVRMGWTDPGPGPLG
jgi:hypothetical protein